MSEMTQNRQFMLCIEEKLTLLLTLSLRINTNILNMNLV